MHGPGADHIHPCGVEAHAGPHHVALRVVRGRRNVHHIHCQFGPFVTRQIGQPDWQGLGDVVLTQVAHKLARDFAKPRRVRGPVTVKGAAQPAPAGIAQQLSADRKAAVQKTANVVEQQFVVHAHASLGHARWAACVVRVAQVRGHLVLEFLEGQHHATCLLTEWACAPHCATACAPKAWCCKCAMCATSCTRVGRSGMLKSRSRQVGTGRPMRW